MRGPNPGFSKETGFLTPLTITPFSRAPPGKHAAHTIIAAQHQTRNPTHWKNRSGQLSAADSLQLSTLDTRPFQSSGRQISSGTNPATRGPPAAPIPIPRSLPAATPRSRNPTRLPTPPPTAQLQRPQAVPHHPNNQTPRTHKRPRNRSTPTTTNPHPKPRPHPPTMHDSWDTARAAGRREVGGGTF